MLQLPEWAEDFYNKPFRYKIAYGGRGSSKSWTFALMLLRKGRERKLRILCAREIQVSIKSSVHQLLRDLIWANGWQNEYKVTMYSITHKTTGTYFFFSGLKSNPDSIKSAEGIDVVFIEEGQSVSEESLRLLFPTIRKEGSEIWIAMNRRYATDYVDRAFIQNEHPNAFVKEVNYSINPWFPEVLEAERQVDLKSDHAMYLHIWEGQLRPYGERPAFYEGLLVWDGGEPEEPSIYGLDLSYSGKNALVGVNETNDREVLEIEIAIESTHITSKGYAEWLGVIEESIIVDSARPEIIRDLKDDGYSARPSKKGAGSVLSGIDKLNRYREIRFKAGTEAAFDEFSKLGFNENEELVGDRDYPDATRYAISRLNAVRVLPWAMLGGRAV